MAAIVSLVSCVRHLPLSQTKPVVVICPGAVVVLELEAADMMPIGVDLRIEIGSELFNVRTDGSSIRIF